jgi:hypothetical protein
MVKPSPRTGLQAGEASAWFSAAGPQSLDSVHVLEGELAGGLVGDAHSGGDRRQLVVEACRPAAPAAVRRWLSSDIRPGARAKCRSASATVSAVSSIGM